jgi:uncharacterized membrane protein YtjA (UPF0391 family)
VNGRRNGGLIEPGIFRLEVFMLYWAMVFLVIALVAALFGFGGIAVAAAGIAKVLFSIFLVLFLVFLVISLFRGPRSGVPPIV